MCFATLFQWCIVEVYFWVFMFQVIFRVDGTFLHLLLLKWIWYLMRDASIASFSPFMVGILWSDTGDPEAGATVYNHDFFFLQPFSLLEMTLLHVSMSAFELDGNILAVLKNNKKSPWRERFIIWPKDDCFY